MADIRQAGLDIPVIVAAIEQKFVANVAKTGVAPLLSSEPAGEQTFVPFADTADGVVRMKNPGPTAAEGTLDAGDDGGLFALTHLQPGVLEWVIMDLGASVAYTISIVTSAGDWTVATGTGQYVIETPRAPIMPGEHVKIVAADPGAANTSWVRVYVRSDQARR